MIWVLIGLMAVLAVAGLVARSYESLMVTLIVVLAVASVVCVVSLYQLASAS